MATGITLVELLDSRRSDGTVSGEAWELHYFLQGSLDETDIRARMFNQSSGIGIPKTCHGVPYAGHQLENVGWGAWDLKVQYRHSGPMQPFANYNNSNFLWAASEYPMSVSYGNMGGQITLTQGFHTEKIPNTKAPNVRDALMWDGEKVSGLEIPAIQRQYSETWLFSREVIFGTPGLIEQWDELANKVHGIDPNIATEDIDRDKWPEDQDTDFRYWKQREVLFKGVTMRQADVDMFEVTFEFEIQKTYTLTLPESIEPFVDGEAVTASPPPWDKVWYVYSKTDEETQDGSVVTGLPKYCYISQIYKYDSFLRGGEKGIGLGIGAAALKRNLTSRENNAYTSITDVTLVDSKPCIPLVDL